MRVRPGSAGAVVALLVLLVGFGLWLLPSGDVEIEGSALSAEKTGRRGLFLVLQEVGLAVDVWRAEPLRLAGDRRLLWLPRVPEAPGGLEVLVESDVDAAQEVVAAHAPAQYRRFLDEGGAILVSLEHDDMRSFVEQELGVELPADASSAALAMRVLRLEPDGERLSAPGVRSFEPDAWDGIEGAAFEAVAVDTNLVEARPRPVLVRVPVGRGALLCLASDAFSTNAQIRVGDHALFAVRIAERFGGGRAVLFDEYALGRWTPDTKLQIATSPQLAPLSAHVALLLLLFAWSHGWPRRFPRDPIPAYPLSALARARAEAGFALRNGRAAQLASRLLDGVLGDLERRLRVRGGDGVELSDRLRALLRCGAGDAELAGWLGRLASERVVRPRDLERLADDLDELTRRVLPGEGREAHDPNHEERES